MATLEIQVWILFNKRANAKDGLHHISTIDISWFFHATQHGNLKRLIYHSKPEIEGAMYPLGGHVHEERHEISIVRYHFWIHKLLYLDFL